MKLELESAIDRALDDPAAYLVYADWLQQHGDPRGQLIALQHAGKTAEAEQLLEEHAAALWGPLTDARDLTERFAYDPLGAPTAWRWGFLHSLWISNKFDRSPMHDGERDPVHIAPLLEAMLDHPSCRFLRRLAVGIVRYDGNHYEDVIEAIAKRPRPSLHTLVLGDFYSEETELNWSAIGNAGPLYAAVPHLRSLTLRSGSMEIGAIDLPHLETFTVITGGLDPDSARAIANANWPALETLSLQLGRGGVRVDDLASLFAAASVPKLRHLGLGNSKLSDELAIVLADSALAAQLETLDFSEGTLGDEGAAALVAAKDRFPKLTSIDIANCYLTDAGVHALKAVWSVHVGEQREDGGDPEDRYINAYE